MTRSVTAPDAQALAEAVAAAMLANDRATTSLGMLLIQITPGAARLRMTVLEHMLNGHATCHGGLIATLADSAFAFACNSYNETTVAAGFDVNFIAPAKLNDVLTATASEVSRSGRTGVYDVVVCNQHQERIAVFRGRSYTMLGRSVIQHDATGATQCP